MVRGLCHNGAMDEEANARIAQDRLAVIRRLAGLGLWRFERGRLILDLRAGRRLGATEPLDLDLAGYVDRFVHDHDRAMAMAALAELEGLGDGAAWRLAHRRPDGAPVLLDGEATASRVEGILRADDSTDASRWRTLADLAEDGILVHGAGRVVEVNPAISRMSGWSRSELIGRPVLDLIAEEEQAHIQAVLAADLEGSYETVARRRDGGRLPVEVRVRTETTAAGRVRIAVVRDVSQERRLDRLLTDMAGVLSDTGGPAFQARLVQALAESLPAEIVTIARRIADGVMAVEAVWRDGAARPVHRYALAGTPCEQILNENAIRVWPAGLPGLFPTAVSILDQNLEAYGGAPIRGPDGRPLGVLAAMSRRPFAAIRQIDGLLRIFAGRVAAEWARAEQDAHLQEVLGDLQTFKEALDVHALVSRTDRAGRITYANDTFCRVSGFRREDLIGARHNLVKSDRHPPEFFKELWRTISSGRIWQGEIENRARDGHHYWVFSTILPLKDAQGRPREYVSIRTDITALKRHEQALAEAAERAEAASAAKSRFLANMSHEMRTPLNPVIGLTELLASDPDQCLSDRYRDYVATILGSARHLAALVDDLLDIARIEADRLDLDDQLCVIDDLVAEVVATLTPAADSHDVVLATDLADDLPVIRVDTMRLRQILLNLGQNAIKFGPGGRVVFGADHDGAGVRLTVADQGSGMDPDSLPRLMEPFEQADRDAHHAGPGGVGLGLPLAKRLTELHGGHLEITTAPGAGTTVTLHLPADRVVSLAGQTARGRAHCPGNG